MKQLLMHVFLLIMPVACFSQTVEVKVVDVGAGLCSIIKLPNNKFIIYDTGNGSRAKYQIDNTLNKNSEIELLILSHTDSDHWGMTDYIVNNFKVKKILKTDFRVNNDYKAAYLKGMAAIKAKKIKCLDLKDLAPGDELYNKDHIQLFFMCGFVKPLKTWEDLDNSKLNNGVSVVVKLVAYGQSVLFCGDAVGKDDDYNNKKCSPKDVCIATERFMLDNLSAARLKADVIIAPHHGADNASSTEFITVVNPTYVIFSAGDEYVHPRDITAKIYMAIGVNEKNIYRTDYFDEAEGGDLDCSKEWKHKRNKHSDKYDDDVLITLDKEALTVKYLYP